MTARRVVALALVGVAVLGWIAVLLHRGSLSTIEAILLASSAAIFIMGVMSYRRSRL